MSSAAAPSPPAAPQRGRGDAHGDAPDVDALLSSAVAALGGTRRDGQHVMARAVDAALRTKEHLLVQAGTGTGKSLAYLVPLARRAVESRRPVVVSTATLALQNQVAARDLPRLADALEPLLGRRLTWQVVKGRANHLCVHKLDGGFPEDDALFEAPTPMPGRSVTSGGPSTRLGREVVRLREWAGETETGDRDDLVPGVSDTAWRQLAVTARECLGASRCPQAAECFSERARERSREVDVVVTNHALLAIDAFEGRSILPEHEVLVVDEAHELADRVTSVVSAQLTAASVAAAATRARQSGTETERLDQAGEDLGVALAEVEEGRFVRGLPELVHLSVSSVRDAARELVGRLRPPPGERPTDALAGALAVAKAAVGEVHEVAERMAAGSEHDVLWLSVSDLASTPSAARRSLHVAPLQVAGLLREALFAERTVVMTSATLTTGGTFTGAAQAVGLARPPAGDEDAGPGPAWDGLDVGSPFDYPRQGILYLARHLPAPGREGAGTPVVDEVTELVRAAGGRTLGLFSSRRAAEAAAEVLRERLDVPVLCQGDDVTPTLVREFAADPTSVLVGTLSLWQGVDVPGPSCQLVTIDRIPFPRPDDPLLSARAEAVARAGGNGFLAVSAQHAALRLAQGAGRLVRSSADRGVVAVLDPRLATARYGGFLRASLPPLWATSDRDVVLGALRRLDAAAREAEAASA
ncbi:ATP-dependent DNA helicase [Pseudokineococcus basanitobsidens]|uniref:DNA 5'-3' helicase n=1 Tax=Pseudokineococcus basanitobsidens TaxID=1926649 RepID=A0ABU8RJ26_9ACTN